MGFRWITYTKAESHTQRQILLKEQQKHEKWEEGSLLETQQEGSLEVNQDLNSYGAAITYWF